MGLRAASAVWGLAEATLFFFVPDVLLSAIALRDRGLALRCCLWALGGALAGGALMFLFAANSPDAARTAVGHVPAVTGEMLTRVESGIADVGSWAMFLGPLTGTPQHRRPPRGASLAGSGPRRPRGRCAVVRRTEAASLLFSRSGPPTRRAWSRSG